jgi:hypothetical protein
MMATWSKYTITPENLATFVAIQVRYGDPSEHSERRPGNTESYAYVQPSQHAEMEFKGRSLVEHIKGYGQPFVQIMKMANSTANMIWVRQRVDLLDEDLCIDVSGPYRSPDLKYRANSTG